MERSIPVRLALALAIAGLGSSLPAAAQAPSVSCSAVGPAGAGEQRLSLRLRDAYTGRAVRGASIRALSAISAVAACRLGRSDRAQLGLGTGAQPLLIQAPGYRALEVQPVLEAGKDQSTSAWLGPLELPSALRTEWVAAQGRPGYVLLHGHVVDAATGEPIAGASLRASSSHREARTDADGYFLLHLPLPPAGAFATDDLHLEAAGHRALTLEGLQIAGPDLHLPLELEAGAGAEVRPQPPHPLLQAAAHDTADGGWDSVGEGANPSSYAEGDLATWDPPASINVDGYGWMALEDYVANGLDNEWISSWAAHSLRAGAIAYRGYGAWYQANSGHICASTSCQVYVPGSSASTIAAAQYTAGILIERSGALAKSEYSAENNNFTSSGCTSAGFSCSAGSPLPCANGQAGGTSWSCLADSHSFASGPGSCCFGHGRGMCQWGTKAWATAGSTWAWMVNHYYNDMGAGTGLRTMYMTTPVRTTSASGPGGTVTPGGSFVVNASVANRSAAAYTHVLFRTQLYAAGLGFVQNGTAPASPSLPANSDTPVSATFTVPAAASGGTYFVVAELWFDVNENGVLDLSVDLMLHQFTGGTMTVSSSCGFNVAQGASGAEATAISNAHAAAGGQAVLGCPTGVVGSGFTSWNGTQAHYQNFSNGAVEYMLNGSFVGQAFTILQPFYAKWTGLGMNASNPMGYPVSVQSAQTSSCIGTAYKFQRFEGGHLEYHMAGAHSGQVYEIHGLIRSKWDALGFAGCPLGLPTSDERNASASPQASTGRVNDLEGGHIHYRYGDSAAYATWSALDSYYASVGGSASCLGFPAADQTTGGNGWPTATFEGGTIFTTNGTTFQKSCSAAGANNAFAGAQVLVGLPVRSTGSNVGATKEPGEPNHGGNLGGASAWWSWTAPFTAAVSISTGGSSFDTLLGVYTGSSVAGLALVAQNDDNTAHGGSYLQSRVQFTAQGGSTYRIAVDGYNSGTGAATGSIALRLHPAPTADLNADGRTDLLLWNAPASALSTWTMDESGARVAESALSPSGPASAAWQVVGTNDFNADQKTDLVYWDSSTGQVQFWLMNGTSRIGGPVTLGGAAPLATSWRVVATGDFNRDGWPDLLWRDTATHKLVVWVMSATNRASSIVPVPDQAVDANWAVTGALDYDGDGARDLLWYNATTGKIVFWFMNASVQRINGQFASPTNAGDNNWKVVAAGDYGIGAGGVPDSNDILWRNASSGKLVLWFMNTVGVRTNGAFTSPDSPADALGTTVVGPK